MGGGEGAKERRKLKRLKSPTTNPTKSPVTKGPSLSVPLVKTNQFITKKSNNVQSKTEPQARKEKKVKKPKHLKRKLEQLSQDDEQTREIILKELVQFEEIKSKLAQKSNRKRPKSAHKENDQNASKATFTRDADTHIDHDALQANRDTNNSYVDSEATMAHKPTEQDNNDDDSDAEEKLQKVNDEAPRRERGRRRRGRTDTAKQILETQDDVDSEHNELVRSTDKNQVPSTDKKEEEEGKGKDQKRYCIGRKPVTDFVMGQKYGAKVVYVKDFGVFFDIGCHTDAFCHVSRLHDDFVKNPHEMFNEGDEVEVRVVEIDRKQKRITVSLQSDERIADERASLEARANRKTNRKESRRTSTKNNSKQEASHDNNSEVEKKNAADEHVSEKAHVGDGRKDAKAVHAQGPMSQPPDELSSSRQAKSAAEDKRARKLARRAARREQAE